MPLKFKYFVKNLDKNSVAGILGGKIILKLFFLACIWINVIPFSSLIRYDNGRNIFSSFYSYITVSGPNNLQQKQMLEI